MDTIIRAIQEYFKQCPHLSDGFIHVNFLPEKVGNIKYSVDPQPATSLIQQYVDGGARKQFVFTLRSIHDYGNDVEENIKSSGLWEAVSEWIMQQERLQNLPDMPTGYKPERIEVLSTAYPEYTSITTASYQMQLALIYYQEGNR